MKNSLIDNQGFSLPTEKKTKLEVQIAELQTQERQIQKQLKLWESKLKKANNLANCLETANTFADKLLTETVASEKAKNNSDTFWLEHLLKNKIEFNLKFEAGAEIFTTLILKKTAGQVKSLGYELDSIQSQLRHQERKFARLQARRQGKTLLDCEYRQSIGCLGDYQCDNCQVNYSTANSVQTELRGGAY